MTQPPFADQHTAEVDNLAPVNDRKRYSFDTTLLEWRATGRFWEILDEIGSSLVVSREYEHFVLALGAPGGIPYQSPLPLPHPSGMAFDGKKRELIVSSTRTPNLVIWFRAINEDDLTREIVPAEIPQPDGLLFLPCRSILLPGSLNIHEIAHVGGDLVATITGHNFAAQLDDLGGWRRAWWPRRVDTLGVNAFRENMLQLNGIAAAPCLEQCLFTAFSNSGAGPKPWKEGYGPDGKGVIFSGETRDPICAGLTCPHSVRKKEGRIWICNSGYGELAVVDGERAQAVVRLPSFTRGLAFHNDFAFVGLSCVIKSYEPYAPGLDAAQSECGVAIIDCRNGAVAGTLVWPNGYQVFDVQVLPDVPRVQLPYVKSTEGEVNTFLRYLG